MYWDVTSVEPVKYLVIKVTFVNGLQGTVCFKPSHLTGVFKPLKDKDYFNQVFVSHGVVTWPGEIDLAPDAMYAEIKAQGQWILD